MTRCGFQSTSEVGPLLGAASDLVGFRKIYTSFARGVSTFFFGDAPGLEGPECGRSDGTAPVSFLTFPLNFDMFGQIDRGPKERAWNVRPTAGKSQKIF